MTRTVYGIYMNRDHAEEALDVLRNAGFRPEDISVLLPENVGTKDLGYEKHTKAPEKAAIGGTAGGLAGGILGWLAGIGALAIPGVGPLIAAGPIVATLAGFGAGSVLGGLTGALVGAGVPEYEAKRYEGRIRTGGALLSIYCETDAWVSRGKEMLRHTGAENVAVADSAPVPRQNQPTIDRADAEPPVVREEV